MKRIKKIISGGQTGADRAAFDFALENGFETGGFVPKNRLAEDGRIPEKYSKLQETETEDYAERTGLNVKNSDATIVFSHGKLSGGSLLTREIAEENEKPFRHIDFLTIDFEKSLEKTKKWLASIECEKLNIAGARASEDFEIYDKTKNFLEHLFSL